MKIEEEIQQKQFRNTYHRASLNLIYTGNWLITKQEEVFKTFGITFQQYNILRILKGQKNNPITASGIKERMLDQNSDVSRIIERMRKKNWLERKECASDRRKVDILITKEGLDLLKKMDKSVEDMDKFLHSISVEEIEILDKLLDKLRG